MKIRQEINLDNEIVRSLSGPASKGLSVGKCDLNDYNGATYYWEIVAKNDDSLAREVKISRYDSPEPVYGAGSGTDQIEIPANTTNFTLFRHAFTPRDGYPYSNVYMDPTTNDYDVQVKSARIIIIQDATDITDTMTQIEIGAYEIITQDTTFVPLSYPKYWKYEAAKFDPAPSFELHVSCYVEDDMYVGEVKLQEDDGTFGSWSDVTDAGISSITSETPAFFTVGSFSLTDGRHYRIVANTSDDKGDIYIHNAKIVIIQSDVGGITKLQNEYLLINENQVDTGLREFMTLFDADEWDGVDNVYYHEHSASDSGSNTKLQEDPGGTPADIVGSDITGENLVRGEVIDSYLDSDGLSGIMGASPGFDVVGQSFQSPATTVKLGFVSFWLSKVGAPPGSVYAKLYAHTGTYGTSSKPTGSPLIISYGAIASTFVIDAAGTEIFFFFPSAFELSVSTYYVVTVEYVNGDGSNYVRYRLQNASPTHGGNMIRRLYSDQLWYAYSTDDLKFSLYGALTMPLTSEEIDTNIVTA